ncbi:hypothetical protein Y1Q_0020936 [Alligator mississippiensis]|uniref:Uncharacterized protein n=1 Tax=Alligator mississippiensis TaxID=8496 RepID=A0A151NJR4_ALLMI|nr:hypothetical protein Y1Q_0020936 [Alligator mississippiensis]
MRSFNSLLSIYRLYLADKGLGKNCILLCAAPSKRALKRINLKGFERPLDISLDPVQCIHFLNTGRSKDFNTDFLKAEGYGIKIRVEDLGDICYA